LELRCVNRYRKIWRAPTDRSKDSDGGKRIRKGESSRALSEAQSEADSATSYEDLSSIKWVASFGDLFEGPTKQTWPPGLLPRVLGVDKWQRSAVLSSRKMLEDQKPHVWVDGDVGQQPPVDVLILLG
jgi:hypothetical protein